MPTLAIPTVQQANSKYRLCQRIIRAYEAEQYELHELHRQGTITQQELEQLLDNLEADMNKLRQELNGTRIIHHTQNAA